MAKHERSGNLNDQQQRQQRREIQFSSGFPVLNLVHLFVFNLSILICLFAAKGLGGYLRTPIEAAVGSGSLRRNSRQRFGAGVWEFAGKRGSFKLKCL